MVKTELTSSLQNYKGLTATNVESLLWNAAMMEVFVRVQTLEI